MKINLLAAALLASVAMPVYAQNTNTNTNESVSGSGAEANSGSQSGAVSVSDQTQTQNAVAASGNSESVSNSAAGAISGSVSGAESNGNEQGQGQDQGQSQGQSANNTQGQGQSANNTQSQGQDASNSQGQMQGQSQDTSQSASNQQGVTVNQQWNSTQRKRTYNGTNTAVPLAASSSFSSDYCGGTVSGGASAAPIGISIGASGTRYDKSCQSLRRAEKFGMAAANAANMRQPELASRLMGMMVWSICTSDSSGAGPDSPTAQACSKLSLLGGSATPELSAVSSSSEVPYEATDKTRQEQEQQQYKTPTEASKPPRGITSLDANFDKLASATVTTPR